MKETAVPFLDLVALHRELEEELVSAFRSLVRSAEFVGGSHVEEFEREFAEYCGVKYCIGVASGTDALRFALIASGVEPGDAVLTVANTFVATVEAISQAGAATEFVDVDERTHLMSPRALESYLAGCRTSRRTGCRLGQRTGKPITAIVPVHLYGQVADMDALADVAERYSLTIVEDACQAHGAACRSMRHGDATRSGEWRRAGSFGHAGAFSFYPSKNLGACGEAGAVTTSDEHIARTVSMLRNHGQSRKHVHEIEGYNGRLDALQAAFLRVKLPHLDAWNSQRRDAAARYEQLLGDMSRDTSAGITLCTERESSRSVYHLYVIRATHRDALAESLSKSGIHTAVHYPVPLHLQNCYREWGYRRGDLEVTERVASEILSLPMFPGIRHEQQRRVADEIQVFAGART